MLGWHNISTIQILRQPYTGAPVSKNQWLSTCTAQGFIWGGGGGGGLAFLWKLAAPLEDCHKPYMQYKTFEWRKCRNRHFFAPFNTNYFALRGRKHTVLKGRGTSRYH